MYFWEIHIVATVQFGPLNALYGIKISLLIFFMKLEIMLFLLESSSDTWSPPFVMLEAPPEANKAPFAWKGGVHTGECVGT